MRGHRGKAFVRARAFHQRPDHHRWVQFGVPKHIFPVATGQRAHARPLREGGHRLHPLVPARRRQPGEARLRPPPTSPASIGRPRASLALAWLLKRRPAMLPIPVPARCSTWRRTSPPPRSRCRTRNSGRSKSRGGRRYRFPQPRIGRQRLLGSVGKNRANCSIRSSGSANSVLNWPGTLYPAILTP